MTKMNSGSVLGFVLFSFSLKFIWKSSRGFIICIRRWFHPNYCETAYFCCACRGKAAVWFPANSSHMCWVELVLKQFFCTRLGSVGPKIHGLVRALMKFSAILYDFLWSLFNQCLVDFVFTINCVQVLLRLVYNVYLVCTLKLILYNSVLNRTSNTYCRVVFSCMLLCAFTALLRILLCIKPWWFIA